MCVHHNEKRALRAAVERLLRGDKHVFILRLMLKRVDKRRRHRAALVDHNACTAVKAFRHSRPHADRRAHGVKVGVRVPHDENMVARFNLVGKRRGNNARAHLVALFNTLGEAAEELVCTVLLVDGHLVAAAAERHFQCLTGMQFAFRRRYARAADADGDRGRYVIFTLHGAHAVQNGKALRFGFFNVLVVRDEHITPVRHTAQKALHGVNRPAAQDGFHLGRDAGILTAGGIARQLLAVIKRADRNDRALFAVVALNLLIIRVVHKVKHTAAFGAQAVGRKLAVAVGNGGSVFG